MLSCLSHLPWCHHIKDIRTILEPDYPFTKSKLIPLWYHRVKYIVISSLTSSTSSVNQLQQFRIDGLSGLLQHPDQLAGLAEVPRSEESVGSAFVGAAGRTADTMDVVLRWIGIVVIDDKLDILHILTFEEVKGWKGGVVCWDQLQGGKRQKQKSEQK